MGAVSAKLYVLHVASREMLVALLWETSGLAQALFDLAESVIKNHHHVKNAVNLCICEIL